MRKFWTPDSERGKKTVLGEVETYKKSTRKLQKPTKKLQKPTRKLQKPSYRNLQESYRTLQGPCVYTLLDE